MEKCLDGQTDGWTCEKTWAGGAAASVTKAFKSPQFTTSLSLNWQKYVPFTESKQPDRLSVQNKTNSTVAVHG